MRVLLTTDTIGGVWTFTKELATGLLQLGHAVALVSFGRRRSWDQAAWCSSVSTAYGSAFRYDSSAAPLEWMPSNGSTYVSAEPFLLRIADEFSPDLFHCSQFCFGSLPLSVPKVITAHSDVLSWAAACRPEGLPSSAWLAQYRTLVQRGLNGADAVVAPTLWMLGALSRHFRISCKTQVIANGRSLPVIKRNERRALQAVSAGRLWDEAKNLALLSKIYCPFPVLLAGNPRQEGIAAPKLPSKVIFLGELDEDDLLALFRASSIYLATSIYEPFGLAPLEAALCGSAVVANDIPSFREIWGDAALYFENPEALSRLLARLAESPAMLERFRQASLQRALQFTQSRMTEGYLALYSHLASIQQTSAYEPAAYA